MNKKMSLKNNQKAQFKSWYRIALVLFFGMGNLIGHSQIYVSDIRMFTIDDIPFDTIDKIVESVEDICNKYNDYARLLDSETQMVSQEALNDFKGLFEPNAKVLNDLTDKTGTLNYSDYASRVFEFLSEDGVKYKIYGVLIDEISYDSAGYYMVDAITHKYLYNGIESNNSPFYCRNGRIYRLRFTFSIPRGNFDDIKIAKIKGVLARDCEDKIPLYGISVGYNFVTPTMETTPFWQENFSGLELDKGIPSSINVAGSFHLPVDKRDFLFFNTGLEFQTLFLNMDINGYYSFSSTDVEGTPIQKFVSLTSVEEKLQVINIGIPLGLRLNIFTGDPLYVFLDAAVIGYYPVYSKGEITGEAIYSGRYDDGTTEFFNLYNGVIIPDKISQNTSPTPQPHLGVRGGLAIEYVLSDNIAGKLHFSYTHGLTSLFDHEETDTYLFGDNPQSINRSVFNDYLTEYNASQIGFSIGIVYKKRW